MEEAEEKVTAVDEETVTAETTEATADTAVATASKGLKAKDVSLWAKIIAVVVAIAGHVLMWLGIFTNATSEEICACSLTILCIFGTVDMNILVDKFTKKGK